MLRYQDIWLACKTCCFRCSVCY